MRIFVTGAKGYLGTALCQHLTQRKYQITGIDTGFFRDAYFEKPSPIDSKEDTCWMDARDVRREDLSKHDVVVHLAGISNDPMGKMQENDVYGPTREYATRLARMCKEMGIRFIFASSCSVYGIGNSELLDEESQVSPQTGYSRNKLEIEKDLQDLSDKSFSPIALRFATVYGPSPRIRFDVVVNMLAGMAVSQKRIVLNSDGLSWRPNLHIHDLCESVRCCLEWDYRGGRMMVLNVGNEEDNCTVMDLVQKIKKAVPDAELKFLNQEPGLDRQGLIRDRKVEGKDTRTYRVSFEKIRKILPSFMCKWNLGTGIPDLVSWLDARKLAEDTFLDRKYYRLQQLEYLMQKGELTKELRWKNAEIT